MEFKPGGPINYSARIQYFYVAPLLSILATKIVHSSSNLTYIIRR